MADIYTSMGGSTWVNRAHWFEDTNMCTRDGLPSGGPTHFSFFGMQIGDIFGFFGDA